MSSEGRRERALHTKVSGGRLQVVDNHTGSVVGADEAFDGKTVFVGRQVTDSENHRYDYKQGHYDGGGPFYTGKIEGDVHVGHCSLYVPNNSTSSFYYEGPIWMPLPTSDELGNNGASYPTDFRSEDLSDLNDDGATAISRCSPANPVSQLGTGLSETYREGIPSLPGIKTWRDRTNVARAAGSEYLNTEFGWLPLASEINDVVNAARHHRDILNQYHRDEGRNVRRRYDFPIERSARQFFLPRSGPEINYPGGTALWQSVLGEWRRSVFVETETRKWFSGCFTYGLPSSTDSWGRALGFGSDADVLYGIALSPDIVWELTPWSWAVDWFTNAGDVINNVTNFGLAGQVMRYGYMMEETIEKVSITGLQLQDTAVSYGGDTPASVFPRGLTSSYILVTKVRAPANPFGFGLTGEDLSPTQLLITAALGITVL